MSDEKGYLFKLYGENEDGSLYNPFSKNHVPMSRDTVDTDYPDEQELQNPIRYSFNDAINVNDDILVDDMGIDLNKDLSAVRKPHVGFSTNGLIDPRFSKRKLSFSGIMPPADYVWQSDFNNSIADYLKKDYDNFIKNGYNDAGAREMVAGKFFKGLNNAMDNVYRNDDPYDSEADKLKRLHDPNHRPGFYAPIKEDYSAYNKYTAETAKEDTAVKNAAQLLRQLNAYYDMVEEPEKARLALVETPIDAVIRSDDTRFTPQRDTNNEIVTQQIKPVKLYSLKDFQNIYADAARDPIGALNRLAQGNKVLSDENCKYVLKDLGNWYSKRNTHNNIVNGLKAFDV